MPCPHAQSLRDELDLIRSDLEREERELMGMEKEYAMTRTNIGRLRQRFIRLDHQIQELTEE